MSAPRSSLRSFLASAKSSLHNAIINQQRVTLVMGNQSADLDSITSAILLAYFRSSSSSTPLTNPSVNKHLPPSHYPPLYIPVINIPAQDIKIRPELLDLLPYANLEPSHLITLDDLKVDPPAGLNPTGKEELQPNLTRLLLVDHNKVDGPLAQKGFNDRVIGCIDHHVDEKATPPDTGSEPRIIEKCGSCTSLVTQYCRSAWDSLSDSASVAGRATSGQSDASVGTDDDAVRRTWDAQIAKFGIASILIDTQNLTDNAKTVKVDKESVSYLESKILMAPGNTGAQWDRKAFFDEITAAKQDLSKLTAEEILRKDYKLYPIKDKQLGISSSVIPLGDQIDRAGGVDNFKELIQKFAAERKLDLFSYMSSFSSEGSKRRELLFWATQADFNPIVDAIGSQLHEKLGLEPWKVKQGLDGQIIAGGDLKVWWQRKTDFSRKNVEPMMNEIIKQILQNGVMRTDYKRGLVQKVKEMLLIFLDCGRNSRYEVFDEKARL